MSRYSYVQKVCVKLRSSSISLLSFVHHLLHHGEDLRRLRLAEITGHVLDCQPLFLN